MRTVKRKARSILEASLSDIQAGHWKRGVMAIVPECVLTVSECDLPESIETRKKCDIQMGCALGEISMHGGWGIPLLNGYFAPYYPIDEEAGRGPDGVIEAMICLYEALPSHFHFELEEDFEEEDMQQQNIEYNDKKSTSRGRAEQWFRDAVVIAKQREKAKVTSGSA